MWLWLAKCLKKCKTRGNPLGLVLLILGTVIIGLCIPMWFWICCFGFLLVWLGWFLYQKWM